MFLFKYGITSSPIDIGEFLIKCPCCETDQMADIMIMSNYAYFFVIPVFTVGKEANIVCQKCGLKRYGAGFNEKLISNYEEIKSQFRHPWFTYTGVGVILIPVIIGIVFSIFG